MDGRFNMETITVDSLYRERKVQLEISLLAGRDGLKRELANSEIARPGLALAGFFDRFAHSRTQVIGETELAFINSQPSTARKERLQRFFSFDLPMVVVTKGIAPPPELVTAAEESQTTLLSTRLSTSEFISRLAVYLEGLFAPTTTMHGTLVDVYGVGMLYTGPSGIGKSECSLDLVERGHRLVADDVVRLTRKAPKIITGTTSKMQGFHMEVRGVGIIDIERLFGVQSVRMQKRVEVEVRLELWNSTGEYDRLGLETRYTTILGVEIPVVTIPISPGKNITVISEVVAMTHMLKTYGESPAELFSRRLNQELRRRKTTDAYLESDLE
jgi:HPr kinase/phosphorylase